MRIVRTGLLAAALVLWLPAAAAELADGERGRVASIVDGDTLALEGGLEVRLVGIQAPKLPLDRPNFVKWPLADEAKAALARLAAGRTLQLKYGGARRDRYGRALAHLYDEDGRWLQGLLLAEGMARVYSFRDNRALVAEMLALERAARAGRRGIWRHPYYRVLEPEAAADRLDSFQLVEGAVVQAALVKGRLFLNFGPDWRTDFSVNVPAKDVGLFRRAGLDPLGYQGRRVRVRGWIESWNGPMIEATHPEQIEVVSE
jgi:endonuclease YncB( thermonuclease family)